MLTKEPMERQGLVKEKMTYNVDINTKQCLQEGRYEWMAWLQEKPSLPK